MKAAIILSTAAMLSTSAMAATECTDYPSGDKYCITTGPNSESHVWTTPTGKQYVWGKACWLMHGTLQCVTW